MMHRCQELEWKPDELLKIRELFSHCPTLADQVFKGTLLFKMLEVSAGVFLQTLEMK
jgi:hypothetical protein